MAKEPKQLYVYFIHSWMFRSNAGKWQHTKSKWMNSPERGHRVETERSN